MIIPAFLQLSLSIVGLIWISGICIRLIESFTYYMKFKRFPMSSKDLEIKSLENKIEFLTEELDDLRSEYSELTKALLGRALE